MEPARGCGARQTEGGRRRRSRADARGSRRGLGRARTRRPPAGDCRHRSDVRSPAPDDRGQPDPEPAVRRSTWRRQDRARAARRAAVPRARSRQRRAEAPAVGDERRSHRRGHGLSRHVAAALPRDRQGARRRQRRAVRRSARRRDGADVRRCSDYRSHGSGDHRRRVISIRRMRRGRARARAARGAASVACGPRAPTASSRAWSTWACGSSAASH